MAQSDTRIMMNAEELTTKPAEYHSVVLENGKTLRVDFYFDKERIALETINPVTDLNDLCTFFTRITTHELYDCEQITVVEVQFEDRLVNTLYDDKESIRFRVGPLLAFHLKDSRVVLQGSRKLAMTPDLTVNVRLHNNDLVPEYRSNVNDLRWRNHGTRGIAAITPEPCRRLIFSEVAALFSNYFYSLFYGGYKESKEEWISMQDVKPETIADILRIFVASKDAVFAESAFKTSVSAVKWSWFLDMADHCDRFMFVQQLPRVLRGARALVSKLHETACDANTACHLQQISTILRNNELMQAFARKFYTLECLSEWEGQFAHILTPEFAAVLDERRLQLPGKHSKLTMQYEQGAIVCMLLDELHPTLIDDLHSMWNEGRQVRAGTMDGLPAILPTRNLKTDATNCTAFFELRKRPEPIRYYYLMYCEFNDDQPYIAICNYQYSNGWLMGVVSAGAELIAGNRGRLLRYVVERP